MKRTLISILLLTALLTACSAGKTSGNDAGGAPASPGEEKAAAEDFVAGADIVIPIAGISETASFYPAEIDGTRLEVIAVKAPDGTVRTAFNTCQVCYDSGRGYYKQDGDVLVCQNCGNQFPMDRVEVESGG
ncbi:MAG: DUF2318 domain-containing protein, partial [Oscillospiraceae bacterium]|nr:DUF2318 domain-containing protein [Oscillospiraceae bacterium]